MREDYHDTPSQRRRPCIDVNCGPCGLPACGWSRRSWMSAVVENLLAVRAGQPLTARYDGYTSCPVVTGRGRLIMAEFNYAKEPIETFPADQRLERFSMYALKACRLPRLYWHGMLRGRA